MLHVTVGLLIAQLNPTWLSSNSGYLKNCHRYTDVFGVKICVSAKAWAASQIKCNHVVNVMAQLLDNDADGIPDDPAVLQKMVQGKYGMWVPATESDDGQSPDGNNWQMTGIFEAVPNSCDVPTNRGATTDRSTWAAKRGSSNGCNAKRDATTEECFHLITAAASRLWPAQWGSSFSSAAGQAIEQANGNCGWGFKRNYKNPSGNSCQGQYAYDDTTCDEACIVVEGIYWASISYIGGLYTNQRASSVKREWLMTSPDAGMPVVPSNVGNARTLEAGAPALYNLVSTTTGPKHAWLPEIMPNGIYQPSDGSISSPPSPPPPPTSSSPCGCEVDGEKFCNYDDESTGSCEDCSNYPEESACYDDGLTPKGAEDCAARCFGSSPTPCVDKHSKCARKATVKRCGNTATIWYKRCPKTCHSKVGGRCSTDATEAPTAAPTAGPTEQPECKNSHRKCPSKTKFCKRPKTKWYRLCPLACGRCTLGPSCRDTNSKCSTIGAKFCHATNSKWYKACPATCGRCLVVD